MLVRESVISGELKNETQSFEGETAQSKNKTIIGGRTSAKLGGATRATCPSDTFQYRKNFSSCK